MRVLGERQPQHGSAVRDVDTDEFGQVNQTFAEAADDVILMVAGLPVNLKALGSGRGPA